MLAIPGDPGPIYFETNLSRFPVEPWSTLSNLVFLFIIIYWVKRTRLNVQRYPLIIVTLPLLLVGFVGGSLYHAFRDNPLWLYMDFVPILILALLGSYFFWRRLFDKPHLAVLAMSLMLILSVAVRRLVPPVVFIPVGYAMSALMLLFPAVLWCRRCHWERWRDLLAAASFFIVAVFFRQLDSSADFLPMGTHFLWHLCGGAAVFSLMHYAAYYDGSYPTPSPEP